MEQEFIISKELAEGIANYLARQPWVEVDRLVHGLQGLQPVPVVADEVKP